MVPHLQTSDFGTMAKSCAFNGRDDKSCRFADPPKIRENFLILHLKDARESSLPFIPPSCGYGHLLRLGGPLINYALLALYLNLNQYFSFLLPIPPAIEA